VSAGVLVAADLLGVSKVYKVGGAQAVAALAYGTETIEAVDKIVGPGNIYVALAKREVFGITGIDMLAGPSDILVVTDEEQDPVLVAADLLSQAEHDPLSRAVCVTPDRKLAEAVAQEVHRQLATLPRSEIARASIEGQGVIYVTSDLDEAAQVVNALAPEHVELLVKNPYELVGKIKHAGAIFLGSHSSEPIGDYLAGPSHVLPTNGTARFSSPLSVDDFVKKSSLIAYSAQAFKEDGPHVVRLARYEGLEAHAQAIERRLKGGETTHD
jgi:histidinol dehydrogenase